MGAIDLAPFDGIPRCIARKFEFVTIYDPSHYAQQCGRLQPGCRTPLWKNQSATHRQTQCIKKPRLNSQRAIPLPSGGVLTACMWCLGKNKRRETVSLRSYTLYHIMCLKRAYFDDLVSYADTSDTKSDKCIKWCCRLFCPCVTRSNYLALGVLEKPFRRIFWWKGIAFLFFFEFWPFWLTLVHTRTFQTCEPISRSTKCVTR